MKKLALNKESIRNLDKKEMSAVNGGSPTNRCTFQGPKCLVTRDCPTWLCP